MGVSELSHVWIRERDLTAIFKITLYFLLAFRKNARFTAFHFDKYDTSEFFFFRKA